MGDFKVKMAASPEEIKQFTKNLLRDVQALETMLDQNWFEEGISKIGAEQEFCLVDSNYKPYPINLEVLEKANMENLSPELAKFNLETNATPQLFEKDALSKMETEIQSDLKKLKKPLVILMRKSY